MAYFRLPTLLFSLALTLAATQIPAQTSDQGKHPAQIPYGKLTHIIHAGVPFDATAIFRFRAASLNLN